MVENTFRVGKTQWSKWNEAGREAYNKMRRLGFTQETGIAEANAVTGKAEEERKDKKRGFSDKLEDAVETVADVAAAVSPVVVAKTVVKATTKKGK